MGKFKVGCSPLTSEIWAGNVLKDGQWGSNKKLVTDTAPMAVAQYLLQTKQSICFTYRGERYILEINKIED